MIGLEAAQSAFGDLFRWFRDLLLWPVDELYSLSAVLPSTEAGKIRSFLQRELLETLGKTSRRPPGEDLIALDWLNGRNSPDVDERVRGAFAGLAAGTTAVDLYRSLVEAASFGAKAIARRFGEEGIRFDRVAASGGVAKKSPYVMQVLCDVLETPIEVAETDFAGARGAAIFGALAAGIYRSAQDAQNRMGSRMLRTYSPNAAAFRRYRRLFDDYEKLGHVASAFK
jgi:L-ribulokinase